MHMASSPAPNMVRYIRTASKQFFLEFPKVFSKGDFPIHTDDGLVPQIMQYIDAT